MYDDHTIGVIVPAYNEAGLVEGVLRSMPAFVDVVYAIDDCSTDRTWEEILRTAKGEHGDDGLDVCREPVVDRSDADSGIASDGGTVLGERGALQRSIGRVRAIRHAENRGAGGAIKTGYLAALADGVDIVVTVDGDGQMDLGQMSKLLDPIVEGQADYAKGNRLLYRSYREQMPRFRFLGNAILTFLTKMASGYWKTMDPQNGYTAISRYALENSGIEEMYEYYGYCNDVLVKLNAKGMRVADVAIPAIYGDEESHIRYSTYIWNVSGMLLRNFGWRLKVKYLVLDFHPLALFYAFGLVMAAIGTLGAGWSLYTKFVLGDSLFVKGAISLLIFTIGSLFLMFAMLFDMQVNESREVQIYE